MQRVAVARAIYQKPSLYLADEPIASLDPKNSEAILRLLAPLAKESPVLGAFHQPDCIRRYCTRAIALRGGKVVYDGPPDLTAAQLGEIYGDDLQEVKTLPPRAAASSGGTAAGIAQLA
jgi:phosphonate transport system ATP-binding protein